MALIYCPELVSSRTVAAGYLDPQIQRAFGGASMKSSDHLDSLNWMLYVWYF